MCFTLLWFVTLLVWVVVLCGVVAIFRLVLPVVLGWLGMAGGLVMQVLNIILAVVVIVTLIWFLFDLVTCAGGGAGLRLR